MFFFVPGPEMLCITMFFFVPGLGPCRGRLAPSLRGGPTNQVNFKDYETEWMWKSNWGYGGGGSLGGESYEGAIGGYLFVCPSTGEKHHKLCASHEQFPAALF